MQGLTAAPRNALTEAQVLWLLEGAPRVDVSYGADLMNQALDVIGSLDLLGGSVRRSYLANIHGTCDLTFDADFNYASGLVRPWMKMTADNGVSGTFYLGVYSLTTPENAYGESPRTRQAQGYDRLYLLDREVGDSWVAPAGAGVLSEVRRAVAAAGLGGISLDTVMESTVLPNAMIWPLIQTVSDINSPDLTEQQQQTGLENATTWLRVINDLLFSVGYQGLYADPATGVFRSGPYINPSVRASEHYFDFDATTTIVSASRTRVDDNFKAPNVWVFVRQTMPGDPPQVPVEGDGVFTVDLAYADPRGLRWPQQIVLDVTSQAALRTQGFARVEADMRSQSTYTITTAPWPVAGHGDVYQYHDNEQGKNVRVQETEWTLPLDGSDMSRTWKEIVT